MPEEMIASVAMIAGPPASVRIATRSPNGRGCVEKAMATSKRVSTVPTRMIPVCSKSASTARSRPARAPVWEIAARAPASVRPDFTQITGFLRTTRRARLVNFRGSPKLSRYMRMTSVSGSSSQYSRRSMVLTSALLPIEQNMEQPRFSSRACSRMVTPIAPDCERNARFPATGGVGAKVAFMDTSGRVFTTPMQFGPTIRMLYFSQIAISSSSRRIPSSPTSRKPAEMTTTPPMPRRPQSSRAWGTCCFGTTMMARSMSS